MKITRQGCFSARSPSMALRMAMRLLVVAGSLTQ